MITPWDYRYAQRANRMKASAIRELLKVTENPEIISFAGGLPASEVFPVQEFENACVKVLRDHGAVALQYGATEGYMPLREFIAQQSSRYGIQIKADNVMITSGSQQALDLIGKIFVNEGDRILVEAPTYLGALQAWNMYGAEYTTVGTDDNGINTDEMEEALRTGPKFMYVLPNFHNPLGVCMSLERRKKLVELADRYGVPIIEDDPYGRLRFEGENLPAVEVLDAESRVQNGHYTGNVIYLSTFSKILAPGIRLAWVIAPEEVIRKLTIAKQGTDLHSSTFSQIVAYEVCKTGFISDHIKVINQVYQERRDTMLDALTEHMPDGVSWTHPQGGLFLWVRLPEICNTTELFPLATKNKVAYVPGESFYPYSGGLNSMRLNFSYSSPEKINEGISRLGTMLKEVLVHA